MDKDYLKKYLERNSKRISVTAFSPATEKLEKKDKEILKKRRKQIGT
jgi:hypothetical protein